MRVALADPRRSAGSRRGDSDKRVLTLRDVSRVPNYVGRLVEVSVAAKGQFLLSAILPLSSGALLLKHWTSLFLPGGTKRVQRENERGVEMLLCL